MTLAINCDACGTELTEPGALLFSPPVDGQCHKLHVCVLCWRDHKGPPPCILTLMRKLTPQPRAPRTHVLKTWPQYFAAINNGDKRFEYRLNDRDYRVGDRLILREYDPETGLYSGNEHTVRVTYILEIPNTDHVVMSIAWIVSPDPENYYSEDK